MRAESDRQRGAATGETPTVTPPSDEELEQRLAQLGAAIARGGHVPEAREAVKELQARWPDDPRVQAWARVLAPPRVIPTPEAHRHRRPLDRERAWLKQHAREYPGCWLAVHEDRLIAADPDFGVVLAEARQTVGEGEAFLHYQPGEKVPAVETTGCTKRSPPSWTWTRPNPRRRVSRVVSTAGFQRREL